MRIRISRREIKTEPHKVLGLERTIQKIITTNNNVVSKDGLGIWKVDIIEDGRREKKKKKKKREAGLQK